MLHYNFLPYSVGETSTLKAPGRREVGHGRLALKAIAAVVPSRDVFPYTIRVVSEITESNGSSSMATVCGASLSMMAAGIPITKPVAGIAMGLIKDGDNFVVLSDIIGDEDHLGDMDFKVAGTRDGITALQMDIKIGGIGKEIMEIALEQAIRGLNHISSEMAKTIEKPRKEASSYAPKIVSIQIDKDKIRGVIGSGGRVIREICEKSSAKIDIEETGKINVAGMTAESIEIALKMISDIVAVPEVGKIYEGTVIKLTSFGAFVRFLGAVEGLLHISEIANERVENIEDVLSEGESVTVQVIGLEKSGKVRLSVKSILNSGDSGYESSSSSGNSDKSTKDRASDRFSEFGRKGRRSREREGDKGNRREEGHSDRSSREDNKRSSRKNDNFDEGQKRRRFF